MSTHNIPFSIIKKTQNYPKSAAMVFFKGTQERVRNSHGKRATRVRATEDSTVPQSKFSGPRKFTL